MNVIPKVDSQVIGEHRADRDSNESDRTTTDKSSPGCLGWLKEYYPHVLGTVASLVTLAGVAYLWRDSLWKWYSSGHDDTTTLALAQVDQCRLEQDPEKCKAALKTCEDGDNDAICKDLINKTIKSNAVDTFNACKVSKVGESDPVECQTSAITTCLYEDCKSAVYQARWADVVSSVTKNKYPEAAGDVRKAALEACESIPNSDDKLTCTNAVNGAVLDRAKSHATTCDLSGTLPCREKAEKFCGGDTTCVTKVTNHINAKAFKELESCTLDNLSPCVNSIKYCEGNACTSELQKSLNRKVSTLVAGDKCTDKTCRTDVLDMCTNAHNPLKCTQNAQTALTKKAVSIVQNAGIKGIDAIAKNAMEMSSNHAKVKDAIKARATSMLRKATKYTNVKTVKRANKLCKQGGCAGDDAFLTAIKTAAVKKAGSVKGPETSKGADMARKMCLENVDCKKGVNKKTHQNCKKVRQTMHTS